ncbi:MAG: hypothetical protein WCP39_05280 [Chlamydiota bacterium]
MIDKIIKQLGLGMKTFSNKLSGYKNPKLKEMGCGIKKIADKLEKTFDVEKKEHKEKKKKRKK